MNPSGSHYQVLGIATHASEDEIKSAYRKLARTYHPDLNPQRPKTAHDRFRRLQEAYDVLSDPVSRQRYDQSLGIHQVNPPSDEVEATRTDSSAWRVPIDYQDTGEKWLGWFNWRFIGGLLLSILSASWVVYIVNFPPPGFNRARGRATIALILFFLGLGLILLDTFSTDPPPEKRELEDSLREEILAMLPAARESQRGLNEYVYQTMGKPGILSLQLTELQRVKEYLQRRIDERG